MLAGAIKPLCNPQSWESSHGSHTFTLEQLGTSPATHRATTITAEALSQCINKDNGTGKIADDLEHLLHQPIQPGGDVC